VTQPAEPVAIPIVNATGDAADEVQAEIEADAAALVDQVAEAG
jgi:hypothetical protein